MTKCWRIFYHVLFWGLSALFLSLYLGYRSHDLQLTFLFTALLLPVAIATSYTVNYFLFPRYLFTGYYFRFSLYGFFFVILSVYIEMLIIVGAFIFIANYQYEYMIPGTTNIINLGVGMYFIVFLSALVYLVKRWSRPEDQLKAEEQPLLVRVNREMVRINPSDILYLESLDNYVQIHLDDKRFIVKEKISRLGEKLPSSFLRIHRSFIVNGRRIDSFTREKVQLASQKLPISRTYKASVLEALET